MSGAANVVNRASFSKSGMLRNRFFSMAKFSAIPNGYVHPYSWAIAQESGGLASYKQLSSSISETSALLALGINIDATMSASISETNATLALIVALAANLSASGTITQAQLAIILLLQAQLTAGITSSAQMGNVLNLISSLSASMTLTTNITNQVNLSASIGGPTELSPEGLAQAVWNYLKANPTTTGSMKEVLELAKQSADNAFAVSS